MQPSQAQAFFERIGQLDLSVRIAESLYLFPALDVLHVLGAILLAGSIALLDLRLIGAALREVPIERLSAQALPFAWLGAALAFSSGALLFLPQAAQIYANPMLQAKFGLLLLAGVNIALWHLAFARHRRTWNEGAPPWQARLAGVASLLSWAAIIVCGRLIAFVF